MDKQPENDEPAPTPSSASEGVIKILAALTIFALLAQGVVMLRSQVTYLSNLKPRTRRPLRTISSPAPGEPRRPISTSGPSRFTSAFKKYEEKRVKEAASSAAGAGDNGPVRSKDSIIEVYRKHYQAQGIRDEEFIIVMGLEHADASWSNAMVEAARALESKNFEAARDAIEQALSKLDERHLIARARLLGMKSHIAYRAADPEAGRAAQRDADETKIEVAKIMVRAMAEKREGGLTPEQAEAILSSLSDERDVQDNVARVSEIFSGQNEDPEKAPQRIMAMFQVLLNDGGGDKGDGEG